MCLFIYLFIYLLVCQLCLFCLSTLVEYLILCTHPALFRLCDCTIQYNT